MNGKQAKRMRKYGKIDKRVKKMYNELSHEEKNLLNKVYEFNIQRKK